MAGIITSNKRLLDGLNRTRFNLTSPYSLRLFGNPFLPNSGTLITDFVEGPFFGYSRQVLTDKFATPVKVRDGLYQSQSDLFQFDFEAPTDTTVAGWWISDDVDWLFCGLFDVPQPASAFLPVRFYLSLQQRSDGTICL